MKTKGVLNSKLAGVIAAMGHHDSIAIVDIGYPIPRDADVVELSLTEGIPSFLDTLSVILSELAVESATIATETQQASPDLFEQIKQLLPDVELEFVPQWKLEDTAQRCRAYVRTGEFTAYANIVLVAASQWPGYKDFVTE